MKGKDERQIQEQDELEKILRKIYERNNQGGDSIIVDRKQFSEYIKKELAKRGYYTYPVFCGKWCICICW